MLDQSNSLEQSQSEIGGSQYQKQLYEQMSKGELITIIKQQKTHIEDLKEKLKMHGHVDGEKMEMFRVKLEEQIQENEKAVEAFQKIIESIMKAINQLAGEEGLHFSKETLIGKINGVSHTVLSMSNELENENQSQSDSNINLMDEIIQEADVIAKHLILMIENSVKKNKKMSDQLQVAKKQILKAKSVRRQQNLDQVILEKEKLQKLLANNEKERSEFMKAVSNVLGQKLSGQLQNMSKQELIFHIQKLSYRLREVEVDKKKLVNQNHKKQQFEKSKYEELLKELKGIKTVNRKNLSMSQILH